jgi:hypothetical protein
MTFITNHIHLTTNMINNDLHDTRNPVAHHPSFLPIETGMFRKIGGLMWRGGLLPF